MKGKPGAVLILLLATALFAFIATGAAYAQEKPPEATDSEGEQPSLNIYFYLEGELTPVEREVPGGGQMVEFTVLELLKGPSEEEESEGYYTEIPEGVKLQYSTRSNDGTEYSVNLSREILELEGDPDRAALALAQIEKTAREASGAETIGITVAPEDTGAEPQDAYAVFGVEREKEGAESEGGGNTALIIGVSVGIPVFLFLVSLGVYLALKRRSASSRPRTRADRHDRKKNKKRAKK